MPPADPPATTVNDLLDALAFAERRFAEWHQKRQIERPAARRHRPALPDAARPHRATPAPRTGRAGRPARRRRRRVRRRPTRCATGCSSAPRSAASPTATCSALAQSHALLDEVRERQPALTRKLRPDEIPEVVPVAEVADDEDDLAPVAAPARRPRPPAGHAQPPGDPPRPAQHPVSARLRRRPHGRRRRHPAVGQRGLHAARRRRRPRRRQPRRAGLGLVSAPRHELSTPPAGP